MPKRGPLELCSENDINKVTFRWASCFKTNVTAAQPLTDETWTTYGCCHTWQKYEHCCWQRMLQFVCCICWLLAIDYSVEFGELNRSSLVRFAVTGLELLWLCVHVSVVWFNERFLGFVTASDKRSATRSVERSKFSLLRRNYKGGYVQVSCFTRHSPE
jgi:hypothetical protein